VPLVAAGVVVLLVAGYGLVSRDSGTKATEDVQAGGPPEPTERVTEFVGAGGQRIGGTLTLPPLDEGGTAPAVLIIPGLGAIDRNSLVAATPPDALRDALVSSIGPSSLAAADPLYKDLSESLANAGVASFRYEKRGTKPIPLKDGQKLSFDDEVADARAALDLLGKRAEVGSAPIVIVGHDIGGVVAMRLAAGNPRVKAIVAISTAARPYGEVLAADLTRARGPAVGDAFRAAMATLASTGTAPPADTLPEILRPIFSPGQDAYLKSVFALDATVDVFKVAVPVLQVRGGADPAVTAADTDKLSAAVRISGQVMVASSDADHNLTLAGPGHEHSNTATAPTVQRDAGTRSALTAWVKTQFAG
jgi:pimeloyl-ACP methyl ester carboxylesterase